MNNAAPDHVQRQLKKRYRAEWRFKLYGKCAIATCLLVLLALFVEIVGNGIGAFQQTHIRLEVDIDSQLLGMHDASNPQQRSLANYSAVLRAALSEVIDDANNREAQRKLNSLISIGASFRLQDMLARHPQRLNQRLSLLVLADDDVDMYLKSRSSDTPFRGRLTPQQVGWIETLIAEDRLHLRFNHGFFTSGDSAEPEQAGILGALLGSMFTMLVTLVLSFPIGVAAAIYLEEYAKRNRFTEFIEININNLAAVPSVIFGLLGLAIFINLVEMPRSIPLVGGLVLTLMTLPTIIISSRAAIKSVPQSLRDAALGMGASKMQVIVHHVLPISMPGMLTGGIIGMAQALGETAPLLMIGMVAFIVDLPAGVSDPATVLPVQIFLWADGAERAFVERTSAAIMLLLAFLIVMNSVAIVLRKKLEKRR